MSVLRCDNFKPCSEFLRICGLQKRHCIFPLHWFEPSQKVKLMNQLGKHLRVYCQWNWYCNNISLKYQVEMRHLSFYACHCSHAVHTPIQLFFE